jgi:hypothetical protein
MNKIHLFLALVAFALIACKPAVTVETPEATTVSGQFFGDTIANPDSIVAFTEVLNQLNTSDSINVVMKAKVVDVCQTKGCWMNIVDPMSDDSSAVFVQFQDYGFFMPMDIAGREVIVQGVAYKAETSVEDLRHYAEDAGKSEEEINAITAPEFEKKFMASGVILLPAKG